MLDQRGCSYAPRVVGIVDGVFDACPAVWHKEILYAVSRGVAVYGDKSVGDVPGPVGAPDQGDWRASIVGWVT